MTRLNCKNGFMLVEVLVSFTIMSMMLAIALVGISQSFGSEQRTELKREMASFAQSKLELLGTVEPIVQGTTSGNLDGRWMWTVAAEKIANTSSHAVHGYWITIVVSGKNSDFSLTTVKLVRL